MNPALVFTSLCLSLFRTDAPDWQTPGYYYAQTDAIFFDADNDSDLDLAVCSYGYPSGGFVSIFQNNGYGSFSGPVWTSMTQSGFMCLTSGDYDNDGDMDLAAGCINRYPNDGCNMIFENTLANGSLLISFSSTPDWTSSDHRDTEELKFIDSDLDGYLELWSGNMDSRICVYDNSFLGLSSDPIDPFLSSQPEDAAGYSQRGFCFGRFFDDLGTSDPETAEFELLCHWFEISRISIYADLSSPSTLNPFDPIYSVPGSVRNGQTYNSADIDSDGYMDWVTGFTSSGFNVGLYNPDTEGFDVEACGIGSSKVEAASSYQLAVLAQDKYHLIVGMRGLRNPTQAPTWTEQQTFIVNLTDNSIDWTSPVLNRATMAVAVGDVNMTPLSTWIITTSETLSAPNQTFFLPTEVQRVNRVLLDNRILDRDEYHFDPESKWISLVGGTAGATLSVRCTASYNSDLFLACADGPGCLFLHK